MIAKLLLQNAMWVVGLGALLFLPAGTLHWPAAWLYLATTAVLALQVWRHVPVTQRQDVPEGKAITA